MLFEWTEEKLELYVRASRYTGFHRKIADAIRPVLCADDVLTDVGCGPGLIDLELADHVRSIAAIDINPYVVAYLRSEAEKSGIRNIIPAVSDAADILGEIGDVALLCYYSGSDEWLREVVAASRRLVIVVTHGRDPSVRPSKIGGRRRRAYAADMDAFLADNNCSFSKMELRLDFGQPFVSWEEARAFFDLYFVGDDAEISAKGGAGSNAGSDAESVRANAEKKLALVERTGDPDFPYFFPNIKDTAVYFIEKQ